MYVVSCNCVLLAGSEVYIAITSSNALFSISLDGIYTDYGFNSSETYTRGGDDCEVVFAWRGSSELHVLTVEMYGPSFILASNGKRAGDPWSATVERVV